VTRSVVTKLTDADVDDRMPTWSPDGETIAFVRIAGKDGGSDPLDGIYWIDGTGSGIKKVFGGGVYPAWSPDGRMIAVWGDTGISIFDVKGNDRPRFFNVKAGLVTYPGGLSWSPNGLAFAFTGMSVADYRARPEGLWWHAYVVDADGENLRRLSSNQAFDEGAPAWSPDGGRIAFWRAGTGLVVADDDGGDQRVAAKTESSMYWASAWSPDGAWIAFAKDGQLLAVAANGSGALVWLPGTVGAESPSWTR
jgi:Tol biopolymer transport system component